MFGVAACGSLADAFNVLTTTIQLHMSFPSADNAEGRLTVQNVVRSNP